MNPNSRCLPVMLLTVQWGEVILHNFQAAIEKGNVELVLEVIKEIQAAGERMSSNKTKAFVVKLCDIQPFTAVQLGSIFSRNSRKLQSKFLRPMVESGDLILTIPDIPHHYMQAYKIKSSLE